jgi:glucose/arabinose dehydrogenase
VQETQTKLRQLHQSSGRYAKGLHLPFVLMLFAVLLAACSAVPLTPADAPMEPAAETAAPATELPMAEAGAETEAEAAGTDASPTSAPVEEATSETASGETETATEPLPTVTPASETPSVSAQAQPLPYDVSLPPGFAIHIYADDVPNARSLALSPSGTLFVGSRNAGAVYAVLDSDADYVADAVITLASGLNMPNGVAYRDGSLYVAEVNRVLRFDNIEADLSNPPAPVVVNDSFPSDRHHGWKFIRFGPDGRLYVPVGAPCNVCDTDDTGYATITRMEADGSNLETYAEGVRNTVGFDWHPETGDLWFTDNGRDMMGDDIPPDELNHAPEAGMHFGYPYCHGGTVPDPQFGDVRECAEFVAPAMQLGPHVAALGMRFYTGDMFPDEYRNQILIAEHGSWNRTVPIGYRVTLVQLENGEAVSYEPFASGWLLDNGEVLGRPVDVLVMPDGSLLVSDDASGMIYRITYDAQDAGVVAQ